MQGEQILASGNPAIAELQVVGSARRILKASSSPSLSELTASGASVRTTVYAASGAVSIAELVVAGSASIPVEEPAVVGKTRHMHAFLS